MDAKTVRETIIKPKLTDIFGNLICSTLMMKAIRAAMKGINEKERLELMVDAICSDPRVTGMWGIAQTNKQKREWLNALR